VLKGENGSLPTGVEFLDHLTKAYDRPAAPTDQFLREGGKKLPKNAEHLGDTLAYLYGIACCMWGCKGGDHTLEWLAGRVCNQALGSFRLIRCGSYDESLMLTRGIGEIANLLWLFKCDQANIVSWKTADRKTRLNVYGPAAVRKAIETFGDKPPIDAQRYQKLCEVGTHPVPGNAPGHFTGTGRPVLGGFFQEVGVFVCMNELGLAVASSALPLAILSGFAKERRQAVFDVAYKLVQNLGGFDINSYEGLLEKALSGSNQTNHV
jgi:hypothetical protein